MAVTFGSDTIAAEMAAAEAKEAPAPPKAAKEPESPSIESAPAEGEQPPAESKTAAEPEPAKEGEPVEKPKADGGFQRRIDKLTREIRERDRQIEALKRGKEEPAPSAAPAAAEDPDKEPQESDFDDYGTYLKAQARFEVRQELQREREAAEAERRQRAIDERLESARQKHDDFDEVALRDDVKLPAVALGYIQESDQMTDLMYHFGSHPDEAAALLKMTPAQQVRAIARIELKLETPPAKAEPVATPKPKVAASAAPAPIKPVAASSPEKPAFDPFKAGSDDPGWAGYREQRRKELAALEA